MRRVGLLVGRERSFPEALIREVAQRKVGVEVVYAKVEAPRIDRPPEYDVLVDRISHEVTCLQPYLKLAALHGTRIVNNPFWRIADDKYFNTALARKLGVAVPRTVLLPSKDYGDDINAQSLTNLEYVDWDRLVSELGLPMYMKPHWGGGWKDVHRVTSKEDLLAKYNRTGRLTMMLQEEIPWVQYVRCIVIGQKAVLPALWDPRRPHHERYTHAAASMSPLSPELLDRVTREARKLCQALGYDMNTVEFAIRDGLPYAIDFMNSAPDLDFASLGEAHFSWVVKHMADLVIGAALEPVKDTGLRWARFLGEAEA